MTDPQTGALEQLERRPPLPGIAELLSGNSTASESTSSEPPFFHPAFTTEIPATTIPSVAEPIRQPQIAQLPAPGTPRDVVSSALNAPLVAMPAPAIALSEKKSSFTKPIPEPAIETSAPSPFTSPRIKNKSVETIPGEESPEADPPPPNPPPFDTGLHESPPQVAEYHDSLPGFENIKKERNDAQLVEALLPIVESSLEKALYAPKTGLHMYLEPMLRATVRRAIAEQMQTIHHFGKISIFDRFSWRLKALFTSRTFDDIVFERTHRYRVEEVYLLRYQSHSLISYASHDPSRHSTSRKIKYDLSRLVAELKDANGELRKSFKLPNRNAAVVRCGENCFILACVRGPINALVRADLDYILNQIEQRFGERLRDQGQHFLHVLQPLLEGCLLIQSPQAPR